MSKSLSAKEKILGVLLIMQKYGEMGVLRSDLVKEVMSTYKCSYKTANERVNTAISIYSPNLRYQQPGVLCYYEITFD